MLSTGSNWGYFMSSIRVLNNEIEKSTDMHKCIEVRMIIEVNSLVFFNFGATEPENDLQHLLELSERPFIKMASQVQNSVCQDARCRLKQKSFSLFFRKNHFQHNTIH